MLSGEIPPRGPAAQLFPRATSDLSLWLRTAPKNFEHPVSLITIPSILGSQCRMDLRNCTPFTALALQAPCNLFCEILRRLRSCHLLSRRSRSSVELIHFMNASERARKGPENGKIARLLTEKYVPGSHMSRRCCMQAPYVSRSRLHRLSTMCFVYLVQHLVQRLQRYGFSSSRGAHGYDLRAHMI